VLGGTQTYRSFRTLPWDGIQTYRSFHVVFVQTIFYVRPPGALHAAFLRLPEGDGRVKPEGDDPS
jgi:hypothetical protein